MDIMVRGLNPSEEEELFLAVFILIIPFLTLEQPFTTEGYSFLIDNYLIRAKALIIYPKIPQSLNIEIALKLETQSSKCSKNLHVPKIFIFLKS